MYSWESAQGVLLDLVVEWMFLQAMFLSAPNALSQGSQASQKMKWQTCGEAPSQQYEALPIVHPMNGNRCSKMFNSLKQRLLSMKSGPFLTHPCRQLAQKVGKVVESHFGATSLTLAIQVRFLCAAVKKLFGSSRMTHSSYPQLTPTCVGGYRMGSMQGRQCHMSMCMCCRADQETLKIMTMCTMP